MAKRRKDAGEEELGRLYGARFDDFVAERDALAKRVRAEGERELAAEVGKLKKPSRAAWAVNQVVRADRAAAKRLLDAGERLESAQGKALGGGGQAALREAISEHHDAVEGLMAAIEPAVADDGPLSPSVLDRARETLRAVAGDPELRRELAAGRVTRDRQPVGFGAAATETPAPTRGRPKSGPSPARRRKAEQRLKRAERDLGAARKRGEEAQRRHARAERNLEAAQERVDAAQEAQREREVEVEEARAALAQLSEGDQRQRRPKERR